MNKKSILKTILSLVLVPMTLGACGNNNSTSSITLNSSSSTVSNVSSSTTNSNSIVLSSSSVASSSSSVTSSSSSVVSSSSSVVSSSSSVVSSSTTETDNVITIAEAIEIAIKAGDTKTEEEYVIAGTILEVSNATYGEMTVQDETGSLYIYGVYDNDRSTRYDAMSDKPVKGDYIKLSGKLKTFKGTPEMDRGYIVEFKHVDVSENVDLSQYQAMSIKDAREEEDGAKVKISGTVAKMTYAFGMEPSGFYLVDGNSSIYVYDTQVAPQVSVGNNVTIAGEKAYYVLSTEQNSANKFGYKGSCQIDNTYLLENDKGNNSIDLSWCEEKTVKEIMNTPVNENITTNIFKVNAVVNRVPGHDFVNYYFNDLDNETGSYAYSQNSGEDFEYLREFDGKICTVYLSPINCKSTDTGCFYRFIPVQVSYDNYEFNVENAPAFALEYYAVEQFRSMYFVDPAQELKTSVSSSLLGFENVKLTYASSDNNVAYFETTNDVTTFHVNKSGTATITITATYGSYVANRTVEVSVNALDDIDYTDVKTAVEAEANEELVVRGVVASSLVNKEGFYLIDDSGLIAVEVSDSNILKEFDIGNEVIVSGVKEYQRKYEDSTNCGQNVLAEAKLVANLYGNYEYSTESFVETTFDELYTLSRDIYADNTAQGYRVSGKVKIFESQWYTNYYLTSLDGSKELLFYAANGDSQYGYLLKQFKDQEITVDVAMCNWNSAKENRITAIAVITDQGRIVNTLNWN